MKSWMRIEPKVLVDLMHLPSETQIHDAYKDNLIWLLIEHPDIHGETVTPVLEQLFDDEGNRLQTRFVEWRE